MLTEMLAQDTIAFRGYPWQQTENRQAEDQVLYLRRLVAVGLERATMTRVPALDWPADLFADVPVETAV